MMARNLVLPLLVLIELVACQLTPWEYLLGVDMYQSAVLDGQDKVGVRWRLDRRNDSMDFVVFCKCAGWVGLSISSAPLGTPGAYGDIFLMGYDDLTGEGYIEDKYIDLSSSAHLKPGGEPDKKSDLTLIAAGYDYPWTVVRFRRALNTGDSQDVPIEPGLVELEYAFSESDNTSIPHALDDKGSKLVMLVPVE